MSLCLCLVKLCIMIVLFCRVLWCVLRSIVVVMCCSVLWCVELQAGVL